MNVFIDDQPLPVPRPTLAAAVQAARAAAEARGRLVVEATLDGVTIEDSVLEAPDDTPHPPNPGCVVRFATADPAELVAAALRGAAEGLERAASLQREAAERIGAGELTEAVGKLGEITSIWQRAGLVVQQGTALLEPKLAEDLRGATAGKLTELAAPLSAMKRALSIEDWSGLADVLEGDLAEAAEDWQSILTHRADALTLNR